MRITLIAAAVSVAMLVTSPVAAQEGGGHPSVRAGPVRVDLRLTVQGDWRSLATTPDTTAPDAFDLHRARLGVEGTAFRIFEYKVQREMSDRTDLWRDLYVNVRPSRVFQVQGGDFKIPFSLEQLTGSSSLHFAYRSLAASYLAPGRDRGVMAHGSVRDGFLKYQAGVFRRGGENVRAAERADPQSGATTAGRVVIKPLSKGHGPQVLRGLRAGMAFTRGTVEGLNSARGHTVADDVLFSPLMVQGARTRIGAEVEWRLGPAAVTGELIRVSDQRLGQGTDDQDLADVVANGWYVSGAWQLMKERLRDVEVVGRVEALRRSSSGTGAVSLSTRTPGILAASDHVVTFGANWEPHARVRLQTNVIRERVDRGDHVPIPALWSQVFRVQFTL